MEEPEYATVLMRVKLKNTVGEFKAELAAEAMNNIYFGGNKLQNNDASLVDVGIVPDSTITNYPIPPSQKIIQKKNFFHGSLDVNNFVRLIFGVLSVVRIPKPILDPNEALPFLSLAVRPALVKIMSMLDPVSFLRLGRTCRRLQNFALSKNSGVHVPFKCKIVESYSGLRMKWVKDGEGNRTMNLSTLQNISKFPFRLEIDVLFKYFTNIAGLNSVCDYLSNVGSSFSVVSLTLKQYGGHRISTINCWPEIAEFINNYTIPKLSYDGLITRGGFEAIVSTKIEALEVYGFIPVDKLSHTYQMKDLTLKESRISVGYVRLIVQEIAMGMRDQISNWSFENIHEELRRPRALKECFNGISTVDYNHEGPLPESRPLVFIEDLNYAVLLNVDNRIFDFGRDDNSLRFGKATIYSELPVALRPYLM